MTTFLDALIWIGLLLLVLLLFNLVILVHEWGHFLAARWRGLKVEKFQIWFGKPIWKKTYNGVQYGLGTIPFGGFVSLPQMAPMDAIEGKAPNNPDGTPQEPLPPISPWDKIIVAFAGPLFSFLLAVFFACIVWWVGKPSQIQEEEAVIGYVQPDRPAGQPGGLKPLDIVKAVDGKPVTSFAGPIDSLMWGVVSAEEDDIVFSIIRDGKPMEIVLHAERENAEEFKKWEHTSWWKKLVERPPLRKVGVVPRVKNIAVEEVLEHSPAALAGIKKGDVLRTLNGEPIYNYYAVHQAIKAAPDKPLELGMERDGQIVNCSVMPRIPDEPKDYVSINPKENKGELGIAKLKSLDEEARKRDRTNLTYPTPYDQIRRFLRSTIANLQSMFSPKSSLGPGQMSSAIGIMHVYHTLFSIEDGWRHVLWFTVMLNIALAIGNLLPFPVLDGGHITMGFIEAIRKRPLRGRALEYIQASCVVLLMGFMLWIMLKDIGAWAEPEGKEIKFHAAPKVTSTQR